MSHARITSQKSLVEAKHFTVMENTIDFGEGVVKTHHDVYRKPAVSIFPIDEEYNIYLIKQYRYIHQAVLTESIAGMIDEGESPLQAAERELREETGIHAKELKQFHQLFIAGSMIDGSQYLILAKGLTFQKAEPEDTEDIQLYKFPLDEAVKEVMTGEIMTASSAFGILLLDQMRKKGEL